MLPQIAVSRHCCAESIDVDNYRRIVGEDLIDEVVCLSRELAGVRICQINATANGGGVAELLSRQIPIGINNATIANAQNVGFAVPIHFARQILTDLMEMGHPYRPQLGFSGSEITPDISQLFGLPLASGFLVEEVLPHSPAAVAGLRAGGRIVVVGDRPYTLGGDIITAVNGKPVQSPSQIAHILLASRPGQVLRLTVYRHGREIEISILLEKMIMQF